MEKDPYLKQIEDSWHRGKQYGLFWGIVGTLLAAGIIKVFF